MQTRRIRLEARLIAGSLALLALGCSQAAPPAADEDAVAAGAGSGAGAGPRLSDDSAALGGATNDASTEPGDDALAPGTLEQDAAAATANDADPDAVPETVDPGTGPWEPVAPELVADDCLLDPARLAEADAALRAPWAIVRYGRLCHISGQDAIPEEAWSTTKTLGALVSGMVSYQTRDLTRGGRKTGPFSDDDQASHWLDLVPYNAEAKVSHVLAMVAHNPDLTFGKKVMVYDTVGTMQINTLSDMLNAAIAQDKERLGANLEEFTQRFLFEPLGMTTSTWSAGAPAKIMAYSWMTTAQDMARVGLLMLNRGVWNGQRLLSSKWIYRMTHPSFEDGNTGYGYLTWLNAASNHHFGGIPLTPVGLQQTPMSPGPCAPLALHDHYPNEVSGAQDCGYQSGGCAQQHDVGVWQAVGLGGQVIQGHPGLDLVIVVKDLTPGGTGPAAPALLWDAVRPAVIDADPTFAGDEQAFCAAYGSNTYAPDLR